jgi:GrpB-like predicted nucleotidyltransferase (UPF0157 family)
MKDAPIIVEPYNSAWPEMFEKESAFLSELLKPFLAGPIEHVGSTAIPGMAAKPVIDIMVAVESLEASTAAIDLLKANGYCYYPYKADVMHWFCKPTPWVRTHHLHLIPFESELWHQRLAFRDHLRNDELDAKAYAELKLNLAEQYTNDREAYTQKKWPFIKRILDKLAS